MNRFLRPQCPGGIFHIVSRTQGRERWFVPFLQPRIAQIVVDGVCSAGACLIAYAVMENHVHVILAQGSRTLGWVMKPIMQRIALLVQNHHGVDGHVFERRFRSKQCCDSAHARAAILYTHHNPVEAGICAAVADHAWTSHHEFVGASSSQSILVQEVLQLFSPDLIRTKSNSALCRENYLRHLEWWCRKKQAEKLEEEFNELPPPAHGGDQYFRERYATPSQKLLSPQEDLRDAAYRTLRTIDPAMPMEVMRRSYGGRKAVETRRQLIVVLHSQGHRGNAIADFLRVDPSVVSRVVSTIRWHPVQGA